MATFEPGKPVTTRESAITVDAGLKPGKHRFQLVVRDAAGNQSRAAIAEVTIVRGTTPTEPQPTPPTRGGTVITRDPTPTPTPTRPVPRPTPEPTPIPRPDPNRRPIS